MRNLKTHSATAGRGSGGESTIISSAGDCAGVGEGTSKCVTKGVLCGNGVISIISLKGTGDDEGGSGGVVT